MNRSATEQKHWGCKLATLTHKWTANTLLDQVVTTTAIHPHMQHWRDDIDPLRTAENGKEWKCNKLTKVDPYCRRWAPKRRAEELTHLVHYLFVWGCLRWTRHHSCVGAQGLVAYSPSAGTTAPPLWSWGVWGPAGGVSDPARPGQPASLPQLAEASQTHMPKPCLAKRFEKKKKKPKILRLIKFHMFLLIRIKIAPFWSAEMHSFSPQPFFLRAQIVKHCALSYLSSN